MGTDQLRAIMQQAGLRTDHVNLRYKGDDQVLDVAGWRADGSAFNISSPAFTGDPSAAAHAMAATLTAPLAPAPGAADPLKADLDRGAARIAAAVPIAKAIVDGKKATMGLAEKMATLADRAKSVPAALQARADALLPRLDSLEKTGGAVFAGLENVVADAEAGVSEAEVALRQMTNLPLAGSSAS